MSEFPAGWYPQADGTERFWSGADWTDQWRPLLGSFFLPGLGQLINGDAAKGVLMFLGYVFSFLLMFVLVGFLTAPAIWIWGMVDAYTGAQRWNMQRGIVS